MGSRAPFEAALYPQTQRVLYRHASTRATRQPPDERTRAFGRAPGALSRARRVAPGVQTGAPCGAGDVGARVEARRARESLPSGFSARRDLPRRATPPRGFALGVSVRRPLRRHPMTAHASAAEHMARGLRQGLANAPGGSVSVRAAREIVVRLSRSISLAPRDRDPADGTVPNLLHALSHIVELEEQRYEDLCGDGGGSHRSGYPIGRILALVQEDHDVFERFAHAVIVSRDEEPAVLAASLRLARAVLSVTGFQFPLGEDAVVRRLEMLALGEDGNPNGNPNGNPHTQGAFGDAASAAAAAAAAAEAKRGTPAEALAASAARAAAIDALRVKTYAAACLAVALEAEDVASNFVRDGVMEKIMTPLRECIAEGKPAEGSDVARFALGAAADDSPFDPDAAARDVAGADAEVDAKVMVLRLLERGPTDAARLPERLTEARVRSLAAVGEYIESFGAAMRCGAVDVCLALVDGPPGGWPAACARRRDAGIADPTLPRLNGDPQLPESLAAVSALLAHRKFAVTFVDRGGVRALLALPRGPLTHNGFTQCLFGVSQITGAMERLLAPTSAGTAAGTTAARMCVDAALEALEGGHDAARRHAALFFPSPFLFPRSSTRSTPRVGSARCSTCCDTPRRLERRRRRRRSRRRVTRVTRCGNTPERISTGASPRRPRESARVSVRGVSLRSTPKPGGVPRRATARWTSGRRRRTVIFARRRTIRRWLPRCNARLGW